MGLRKHNEDIEAQLYELECIIDTLDLISSGLPDDRVATNALNALHSSLSVFYLKLKDDLL